MARSHSISSFARYQDDPASFVKEILGHFLWPGLIEILEAVRDHPRVAVTGANAVGKGWVAAQAALWWLNAFQPSKIITTAAPPARQIRELLWAEIRGSQKSALRDGIPLCGGEPQTMAIRTDDPQHWAQGFVIPLSGTREERISKFQGHHSPHLLAIFDEAYGVPDEIFDAMDSCLSGEHNHFLLLSNALARTGAFYRRTRSRLWHTINVSAFDHPNVIQGIELVKGAVTRQKTYDRVRVGSRPPREDEKLEKLHPDALFHVPEYFEDCDRQVPEMPPIAGTLRIVETAALSTKVLGRFPLQGDNALINVEWLETAKLRMRLWHEEHGADALPEVDNKYHIWGLDAAEMGNDPNVIVERLGSYLRFIKEWNGVDTLVSADIAMGLLGDDPFVKRYRICHVDATGVGAGIAPYMRRQGYKGATPIKMGSAATRSVKQVTLGRDPSLLPAEEFNRMRSQAYWTFREWLRADPHAMIPDLEGLEDDLTVLTYEVRPDHRLQVLQKADVREALGRSPNYGDAAALTFAQPMKVWRRSKFLSLNGPRR